MFSIKMMRVPVCTTPREPRYKPEKNSKTPSGSDNLSQSASHTHAIASDSTSLRRHLKRKKPSTQNYILNLLKDLLKDAASLNLERFDEFSMLDLDCFLRRIADPARTMCDFNSHMIN